MLRFDFQPMVGFDLFVTGHSHLLLSERSLSFNNVMITLTSARWRARIVELASAVRPEQTQSMKEMQKTHCFTKVLICGRLYKLAGLSQPKFHVLLIYVIIQSSEGAEAIWAEMHENLSSGLPTKYGSYQPAYIQRLAKILKFCIKQI